VEIMLATLSDVPALARLLREFVSQEERATRTEREFAADLGGWWERHSASHVAFLARLPSHGAIGMAWLALVPRVPRPGALGRISGDVQSVFVMDEHRRVGVGTALIQAIVEHAAGLGVEHLTVHAGERVTLYERASFTSSRALLIRKLK